MPASTRSTSAVSASSCSRPAAASPVAKADRRAASTYTSNPGSPVSVTRVTIAAPDVLREDELIQSREYGVFRLDARQAQQDHVAELVREEVRDHPALRRE